ncbi:MAG: hypothetical protein QXW83_00210 [Nitrososphaerales archaeon]
MPELLVQGARKFIRYETVITEIRRLVYSDIECAEPISAYDLVCYDGEKIKRANATDTSRMPVFGMAEDSGNIGDKIDVIDTGIVINPSWNFPQSDIGKEIFVDTTMGGFTTTPPSSSGNVIQRIGRILSPNSIYLNPEEDWIIIS